MKKTKLQECDAQPRQGFRWGLLPGVAVGSFEMTVLSVFMFFCHIHHRWIRPAQIKILFLEHHQDLSDGPVSCYLSLQSSFSLQILAVAASSLWRMCRFDKMNSSVARPLCFAKLR